MQLVARTSTENPSRIYSAERERGKKKPGETQKSREPTITFFPVAVFTSGKDKISATTKKPVMSPGVERLLVVRVL